jgi:luciferase family oxidoreductase group 1
MRRDPAASDRFPRDVLELQGLLSDESPIEGVKAIPGQGTHVPLYVLGSSLFGAQLAAALGLPFAFASLFAPQALDEALRLYREGFRPSAQLEAPYAMAGHNVIAADTDDEAQAQLERTRTARVRSLFKRPDGERLTDGQVREILCSPRGLAVDEMMRYTAAGTPDLVAAQLERFRDETGVQEIVTVHPGSTVDQRLRSIDLLADAALE